MLAGFHTTVLPYTSAGAIFHAGMAMGKLNGVMTPTTPTGLRVTRICSTRAWRGEDLTGLSVALVAVVAQDLRGATHLADPFGLGLAFLGGQLQTPGIGIAVHHICRGEQHRTALVNRRGGPRRRGLGGGRDARVDIGGAHGAAFGDHFARPGRIEAAHSVAAAGEPLAGNQMLNARSHQRNAAWPVSAWPMDSRCISEVPS